MNCYDLKKISFQEGIYDSCADHTYIITMRNSSRRESYMEQINTFPLTKNVEAQI
jgi:hypothetical protein